MDVKNAEAGRDGFRVLASSPLGGRGSPVEGGLRTGRAIESNNVCRIQALRRALLNRLSDEAGVQVADSRQVSAGDNRREEYREDKSDAEGRGVVVGHGCYSIFLFFCRFVGRPELSRP